VNALHEALQSLYQSPEQRHRLGQGAKDLSTQFEWSHIAREMIDFLRQVAT
jgi:hypothetical protein